jgi:hypothetical protein
MNSSPAAFFATVNNQQSVVALIGQARRIQRDPQGFGRRLTGNRHRASKPANGVTAVIRTARVGYCARGVVAAVLANKNPVKLDSTSWKLNNQD